jgi:predicted nucleic-acid-binding protein
MIAFDTNILVRLLVADDARQVARARGRVQWLDDAGERAYVSDIVVCEIVWVLRAAYGFDRATIAEALKQLFSSKQLAFDAPDQLARALGAYAHGPGDFSDYLIREHATVAGCDTVVTFDKQLHDDTMFAAP